MIPALKIKFSVTFKHLYSPSKTYIEIYVFKMYYQLQTDEITLNPVHHT